MDHVNIRTRHLYDLDAAMQPSLRTVAPTGVRSTNLVREATVSGERLRGRVLPGGGDWMLLDADGVGHVDARYVIETDDGALVHAFYPGRLVFRGDSLARLRAGVAPAPDDLYFRVALTFQAPQAYGWLNTMLALGIGRIGLDVAGDVTVHYQVFEVC